MVTKRFWGPANEDRRSRQRLPADFYGVELVDGARYLRKISNVSDGGMMFEDRLGVGRPGELVEFELPHRVSDEVVHVLGEVVRVTKAGQVAVRIDSTLPVDVDRLGGSIDL
ncbi:MAG TPA: PilZ domain-containing protein [Polyangia bacterium]|nr:PilZ domain-containing protein [Polyangia bacterium]